MKKFFVLCSGSSINSARGLQPRVERFSDVEIIEAAAFELNKSGECLEDIAGIPWIENEDGDPVPSRTLSWDECVLLSAQHLESDGRLFELYEDDPAGRSRFYARCDAYGLGDKAQALLEKFS